MGPGAILRASSHRFRRLPPLLARALRVDKSHTDRRHLCDAGPFLHLQRTLCQPIGPCAVRHMLAANPRVHTSDGRIAFVMHPYGYYTGWHANGAQYFAYSSAAFPSRLSHAFPVGRSPCPSIAPATYAPCAKARPAKVACTCAQKEGHGHSPMAFHLNVILHRAGHATESSLASIAE